MPGVVLLDCETTGLDPQRHEIWELALIDGDTEWEAQLPVDLARADPPALRIGRFYERRKALSPWPDKVAVVNRWRSSRGEPMPTDTKWFTSSVADIAEMVAMRLDGKHIAGAVPSFDAAFLAPWLRAGSATSEPGRWGRA